MRRWLVWPGLERYRDLGLLIVRLGLGGMFVGHGWPKLVAGPAKWAKLGAAMSEIGVDAWPTLWGLCAALAEAGGGVLLALGLATRPTAAVMAFTMAVAALWHHGRGDGFIEMSHSIEDGIVFLGFVILGAGRYSLDARLR